MDTRATWAASNHGTYTTISTFTTSFSISPSDDTNGTFSREMTPGNVMWSERTMMSASTSGMPPLFTTFSRRSSVSSSPGSDAVELNGPRDDMPRPPLALPATLPPPSPESDCRPMEAVGLSAFSLTISTV